MNTLNFDLLLQLVKYLDDNFDTIWFKLFQLDKNFYPAYLYNLRKNRYTLHSTEVNKFNEIIRMTPPEFNLSKNEILYKAIKNNQLLLAKYLFNNGANGATITPHIYSKVVTSLIENDNVVMLKFLLDNSQMNWDDEEPFKSLGIYSWTNIMKWIELAFKLNSIKVFKYLSKLNPEVAITSTILAGNFKLLKYSLKQTHKKQNLIKYLNDHDTLLVASYHNKFNIVRYLVYLGANPRIKQNALPCSRLPGNKNMRHFFDISSNRLAGNIQPQRNSKL